MEQNLEQKVGFNISGRGANNKDMQRNNMEKNCKSRSLLEACKRFAHKLVADGDGTKARGEMPVEHFKTSI